MCYSTRVPLDPAAAAALFRQEAEAHGFARIGFATVAPIERHAVYEDWLARGYAANGRAKEALAEARLALPQAPDDANRKALQALIQKLETGETVN